MDSWLNNWLSSSYSSGGKWYLEDQPKTILHWRTWRPRPPMGCAIEQQLVWYSRHTETETLETQVMLPFATENNEPLVSIWKYSPLHYRLPRRALGCDCRQHGFLWITWSNKSFKNVVSGRKWCHLLCKSLASHREIDPRNVLFGCICSIINPSRSQPLCRWRYEVEAAYKKLL